MSALGRVYRDRTGEWWAECRVDWPRMCDTVWDEGDIHLPTLVEAADALRAHLRDEHTNLLDPQEARDA